MIAFTLILTGSADATTDVVLPVSNINARLRSGSDSYLQVTIPYTTDYATYISDRPNGDLELVYTDPDGEHDVVAVALETIQISRAVNSANIVLTGHRQSTNSSPTSHTVSPLSLQTGTTSNNAIVPGYNPLILPGDNVTADGVTYTLEIVSLQAAESYVQTQLIGN